MTPEEAVEEPLVVVALDVVGVLDDGAAVVPEEAVEELAVVVALDVVGVVDDETGLDLSLWLPYKFPMKIQCDALHRTLML